MFKIIHNIQTGEITQVDLTSEELAELKTKEAEAKEAADKEVAKLSVIKNNKAALLDKLGITAEEAQLLLGGN
jgi:hypothetical protein